MQTEEEKKKLIELYNAKRTQQEIADYFNLERTTIKNRILALIKTGEIEPRGRCTSVEMMDRKREMYLDAKAGMDNVTLAKKYGITTIYAQMFKKSNGISSFVPKQENKVKNLVGTAIPGKTTLIRKEIIPSTLNPEETIKCTDAVAKRCVYGSAYGSSQGRCRFSQCTGKCRSVTQDDFVGCTADKCIRFVEITKETPRAEILIEL